MPLPFFRRITTAREGSVVYNTTNPDSDDYIIVDFLTLQNNQESNIVEGITGMSTIKENEIKPLSDLV